ncbi:MAG: Txe/YoeB family addiction module toxin [Rhizobacter sp.]|nr:Txe/YoeB family addiction module toxin [Chlorobiales bacterium]
MRQVTFSPTGFAQYVEWSKADVKIFQKINELIKEAQREPFRGLGKPEPLKGNRKGSWSRRVTDEHRLVYQVTNDAIIVRTCHGHYD